MSLAPSSWAASLMLHALGFAWLALAPAAPPVPVAPPPVEMSIAPTPAPTPAPPPHVEAPEPPHAEPAPVARPSPSPNRSTSSPIQPSALAAAHDEPLDLTSTVLTGDRGDFGMRSGGGAASGPAPVTRPAAPAPPGGGGLVIVAKESLSRLPSPPDLTGALLAHYPETARTMHDAGTATLSIVILPSGAVGTIEIKTATTSAFGQACRATLAASRWSPPLDKSGSPVATRVGYTCHFDVR